MAEVNVEIAGRPYRLGCGEGEEAHLAELAAMLDAEASALNQQFAQIPEGRLMLMTALLIADKLHEANARLTELEQKVAETRQPDMFGPEQQERLVKRIDALTAQVRAAANGAAG